MSDTETLTPGAGRTGASAVHALPTAPSALAVPSGATTPAAPVHNPVRTGALTPSAPVQPVQTKPVQPVQKQPVQPVQAVRKEVTTVQGGATPNENAVQGGAEKVQHSPVRTVMSIVVLFFALAISIGAAYESFFAFERMAIFFGWPKSHAWIVMPLTEAFLVLGSFELAIRIMEGGKLMGPRLMAYGALVITLAVNVGYHVLTLLLPVDDLGRLVQGVTVLNQVHWWQPAALAVFAAIVPTAQLLALHVFSGRLRRLAQARRVVRTEDTGPGVFSLLHRAAVNRIATIVPAPVQPVHEQTAAPVHQPVQTPVHQTAAPVTSTPTSAPAAGAPVRAHRTAPVRTEKPTNVVEINEASKRSMQAALQTIYDRFHRPHFRSWQELAQATSLTKIETQVNIGKRRSKPALANAEQLMPWSAMKITEGSIQQEGVQ